MSPREEFEKAFNKYWSGPEMPFTANKAALFGAKWMADYLKRPDISKELKPRPKKRRK